MVYRVAVVMPGRGEMQVAISGAFRKKMAKLVPSAQLVEFVPERAAYGSFVEMAKKVLAQGFDLVVTVGTKCTVIMQETMREGGTQVPLLFIGAADPQGSGILGQGNNELVSGVSMKVSPDTLPLDAVFMICGLGRRVVILCREDAANWRVSHAVEKMEQYAYDAKVKDVRSISLSSEQVSVDYLAGVLKKDDVVVTAWASLPPQDLSTIEEACKKVGADFFNGTNSMVPPTALCGYAADVECLGFRAAQIAKRVLLDNVCIADIPYETLQDTTKIIVNTNACVERGISLPSKDYIFSLDDKKQYPITYRVLYPFVWTSMVEQEIHTTEHLARLGRERTPGIEFIPSAIQGLHNTPAHQKWVVAQTMERAAGPVAGVGGERMALMIQQEMLKQKKFRSLVIVKSSDDQPKTRAETSRRGWPADCFIQRVTLEVPPASIWIDFLQYLKPDLRTVGFLYSYEYKLLPHYMKDRLKALVAECKRRGLIFIHAGRGVSNLEFEAAALPVIDNADVLMTHPDMFRSSDGLFAGLACHQRNKLFVGSDLARSDRTGAAMGPRYGLIAQKMIDTVADAALGRRPDDTSDLFFSAEEIYGWCVNENWLKLHDLLVPQQSLLKPSFTCVPAVWDPNDPLGGVLRVTNISAAPLQGALKQESVLFSNQKMSTQAQVIPARPIKLTQKES